MSSAALDGWEDEPLVTPAKRRGACAGAISGKTTAIWRAAGPAPALLLDEFQENVRLHRSPRCNKCAFAMNRAAWEAVASLPGGRTWLQPQPVNAADWWVSCSVCDAADSLDNSGRRKKIAAARRVAPPRQPPAARPHENAHLLVCSKSTKNNYHCRPPC